MKLLPGIVRKSPELQHDIRNAVVKGSPISQRTESPDLLVYRFLVAELHLSSLKGGKSPKAVRKARDSFSSGASSYGQVYANTMNRIQSQLTETRDLAKKTLLILSYARRPCIRH